MLTCPNCGAQNEERARFCLECGMSLAAAAAAGESRRTVTVLFSDVVGSTALGEALDPETVRSVMTRYFGTMEAVIKRHGGRVEKFVGDAIMAVFGLPTLHEDDALRAVRAADAMRRELGQLNEALDAEVGVRIAARTGINTGEVVAGTGAAPTLVTGDAVNTAARLEQAAAPADIVLGAATERLIRHAARVEELAPIAAKGKAEPVRAFRLLSVIPAVSRLASDTPLVARGDELAGLNRAFDEVIEAARPGVTTVLGPPGVGKSRLVAEFLSGLETAGRARVLRGRCLSYGEGLTYWPLREIVLAAAGASAEESREDAAAAIARLSGSAGDGPVIADRLATAIGLADGSVSVDEINWAARRTLERLAAERPLAIVVEDIHWARPSMLELLEHLHAEATGPILVVCPARPESLEANAAWATLAPRRWLTTLEGLPPDASRQLLESTPGGDAIPPWLRERILETAEGNPLFVEEMVRLIVESGQTSVAIPPTIEALMAARIDQLPRGELMVAQRGAVVGRVFEHPSVEALVPAAERDHLDGRLRALLAKEVIREEPSASAADAAYKFRHILIRDAAYNAMAKLERAELHEAFANWLEQAAAGRMPEYEEILGYHLEQAYRYRLELRGRSEILEPLGRRAAQHLARGAQRAADRGDASSAVRLYGMVAELPEDSPLQTADTFVRWAQELMAAGRFDEALDRSRAAIDAAEVADDGATRARARLIRLDALEMTGRIVNPSDELLHELDLVIAEAEASRDPLAMARAYIARSMPPYLLGNLNEATVYAERALAMARRADDVAAVIDHERSLLVHELVGSTRATDVAAHAAELAERSRHLPAALADTLRILAIAEAMLGQFEQARRSSAEGIRLTEELRRPLDIAQMLSDASWVERLADDLPAAERRLREGLARVESDFDPTSRGFLLSRLVVVLVAQGRLDEAWSLLSDAFAVTPVAHLPSRVRYLGAAARIHAARGEGEAARGQMDEALELVKDTAFVNVLTDVLIDAAETLRALGDGDGARHHFVEAIALCDAKENLTLAAQLRARLAALNAGGVAG